MIIQGSETGSPQRLMITGIPGTGKTCIGNFLEAHYGFTHYDIEKRETCAQFRADRAAFVERALSLGPSVVVTWGFPPYDCDAVHTIQKMKARGFKLFWFEGDHACAREAWLCRVRKEIAEEFSDPVMRERRLKSKESDLDRQMGAIQSSKIAKVIGATVIDPFRKDGAFRERSDIVREMVEASDQPAR